MADDLFSEPFRSSLRDGVLYDVIFELNLAVPGAAEASDEAARIDTVYQALYSGVLRAIGDASGDAGGADVAGALEARQRPAIAPYLFATLHRAQLLRLAAGSAASIAKIWPNATPAGGTGAPDVRFSPKTLVSQVIAEPLASRLREAPAAREDVLIRLAVTNTRAAARSAVCGMLDAVKRRDPACLSYTLDEDATHGYVFASITGYAILALVDLDRRPETPRAIFRIWEDSVVRSQITESVATVKADAAKIAYSAIGKGIVWAILDSGIDAGHPHFAHYKNLEVTSPLAHMNFCASDAGADGNRRDDLATVDAFGHGTHVAGIVAGAMSSEWPDPASPVSAMQRPVAVTTTRNEAGAEETQTRDLAEIAGMAPQCKLVSLRVLNDEGTGSVSAIIRAFDQIQQWNDHGEHLVVHGVNLSLGYPFEAEWFACGQSPLCVEVDHLVASGVVVVVAAGNSGYGYFQTDGAGAVAQGIGMSINDPGNADLAITVGSTHRSEPHLYGVSYFSSKGPTGDGRMKPDLIAPGERIISCASKQSRASLTIVQNDGDPATTLAPVAYQYREDSGTSMAAPHVSGVIAAFLSIRREYIGMPRDVKAIFLKSATDLGRHRSYQGAGLVDLIRAIQSV